MHPTKHLILLMIIMMLYTTCKNPADKEKYKKEILQTEKSFEKMVAEKGLSEAFAFFADEKAVIKRGNDSLISGKENIREYYRNDAYKKATVNWTPDFIDVSECGTLGYTYGKYIWKMESDSGKVSEFTGVFHTVWKKQEDGSWKYVWD